MHCDEVVRELATPTSARDRAAMAEHLAACPDCAGWARRADQLDQLWEATRPDEPSPEAWDAVWTSIAQALPGTADSAAAGVHPSRNGSGPRIVAPPAPAPVASRPRGYSRRFAAIVLVGLAQAAAILVALGLAWQTPPRPDGPRTFKPDVADNSPPNPAPALPVAIRVASPVKVDVEIHEGRLMLIPASGASWVVPDRAGAMIPGIGGLVRAEMAVAPVVDLTPPEMNFSSDPGLVILNTIESIATPQVAAR
jgi:hypothetical protein